MELVRCNPNRNVFNLRNHMDRMFGDFFHPIWKEDDGCSLWDWNPVVDVLENDENFVIHAELPGMHKEDIHIDVKDRVLTLKGERSSENETKEDNYYRRERSFGRFERSFTLPMNVDAEKIKADYKDGVLKIDIPKPEEKKPKQISIH